MCSTEARITRVHFAARVLRRAQRACMLVEARRRFAAEQLALRRISGPGAALATTCHHRLPCLGGAVALTGSLLRGAKLLLL